MQPICAADHKAGADAFTHPGRQHLRQVAGGQSLSALVKHQSLRLLRNRRIDTQRLVLEHNIDQFASTVFRLQLDQFNARFWRHTFGVFLETRLHPGWHLVAERDDCEFQVGPEPNEQGPALARISGRFRPKRRASAGVSRCNLHTVLRELMLNLPQLSDA